MALAAFRAATGSAAQPVSPSFGKNPGKASVFPGKPAGMALRDPAQGSGKRTRQDRWASRPSSVLFVDSLTLAPARHTIGAGKPTAGTRGAVAMGQFAVILPAAGRSTRFGDPKQKKIYAELEGRAVWLRALDPFLTHGEVEQIIVAIAPEDRELFERRYRDKAAFLNLDVIEGGAERSDTVARALERVRPVCEFVAVHDAARPCLTEEHGRRRLRRRPRARGRPARDAGDRHDQACPDGHGSPSRRCRATISTSPRLRRSSAATGSSRPTPAAASLGPGITDDTQLVEALGHRCAIVAGSPFNLKITTQDDLRLAAAILRIREKAQSERPAAIPSPTRPPCGATCRS